MTEKEPNKDDASQAPKPSSEPKVEKPQQPPEVSKSRVRLFDNDTNVRGERGSRILNEEKNN